MSILAYKLSRLGAGAGAGTDEYARYATRTEFPASGQSDTLVMDESTGALWWWNGAAYQASGWNAAGTALVDPVSGGDFDTINKTSTPVVLYEGDSITAQQYKLNALLNAAGTASLIIYKPSLRSYP